MKEYEVIIKVLNHKYKKRLNAVSRQDAQDMALRQIMSLMKIESCIEIQPEREEDDMVTRLRNIFS